VLCQSYKQLAGWKYIPANLLIAILFYLSNQELSKKQLWLFALLLGVGIGIHYLSLLFNPGWAILSWDKIKRNLRDFYALAKNITLSLLLVSLGLALFLCLPCGRPKRLI